MLGLEDISVTFHANTVSERKTLDYLSFHVEDGDFISVLGTNGTGKSTSLNVISGTIPCGSGTILLDGKDIAAYPEYKRAREIGHLFQNPLRGTVPHMTVGGNLGLAYSHSKRTTLDRVIKEGDRSFFVGKLKELGLRLEDRISIAVGLLNGGQRQVLILLMSTIVISKLLLLDEHAAALDPKTVVSVMDIIRRIVKENHITTLMITHNMKQTPECGNKTIILNERKIAKALEGEERESTTVDGLLNMYDFV